MWLHAYKIDLKWKRIRLRCICSFCRLSFNPIDISNEHSCITDFTTFMTNVRNYRLRIWWEWLSSQDGHQCHISSFFFSFFHSSSFLIFFANARNFWYRFHWFISSNREKNITAYRFYLYPMQIALFLCALAENAHTHHLNCIYFDLRHAHISIASSSSTPNEPSINCMLNRVVLHLQLCF